MNYFTYPTAAERYARGRPFFHSLAIEKIRAICCESGRINRVLDVGCGPGQSTVALAELADEIVGVDPSAEMLSHAICHPSVRYVRAPAEHLPFDDASFALVTVALAFHWLDRRQFMLEAQRVLRPGGWLVIYNDRFWGRMAGNPNYEIWNREHYLTRYPPPPRNNEPLRDLDALEYGFGSASYDEFVHEITFTPDQLVSYLLSQTNVIFAVEEGTEDVQSAARWLLNSVKPFFAGTAESFLFRCQIRFLKRD